MKITVNRKALKENTKYFTFINKNTLPILKMVKFQVIGDVLFLTATNLDMTLFTNMVCVPDENCEFLVNNVYLQEFLKKSKDENITITVQDQVIISDTNKHSASPKMELVDYPQIPEVGNTDNSFNILWDDFYSTLLNTHPFSGKDDPRLFLNGIYFDSKNNVCVATNGHFMSVISTKANSGKSFILPRCINELLMKYKGSGNILVEVFDNTLNKVLGENTGGVASNPYIKVSVDSFSALVRGIDQDYPDYKLVIPTTETKCEISFNHDELINSLESLTGKMFEASMRVTIAPTGEITFSRMNKDCVDSSTFIKLACFSKLPTESLNFSITPDYLLTVVKCCKNNPQVEIRNYQSYNSRTEKEETYFGPILILDQDNKFIVMPCVVV